MKKDIIFKGSGVAIVTPFANGNIDFENFEKLLNYHIKMSTDAIVVCGTTGESATLSDEEKVSLYKFSAEKINSKIPVIAGTGSNSTKHSISLSQEAEKAGADALLVVTPYYNKTSQSGLIKHYKAIAESVNIPIIVYNVPSRTGMDISIDTYMALSEIPNINAVKEASGNISKMLQIKKECKDNLHLYSGNDDQTLAVLSIGGIGVISVAANIIPREMHDICRYYSRGDINHSLDIQTHYLELINSLFSDVNPIPVKTAMEYLKMCSGETRPPLCEMDKKSKARLIDILEKFNINSFNN